MTKSEAQAAFDDVSDRVRRHYGRRLTGVYVVDQRKCWEGLDEPDLEIVLVLDGPIDIDRETEIASDLTYDTMLATGVFVLAHPLSGSAWSSPLDGETHELKSRAEPVLVPM